MEDDGKDNWIWITDINNPPPPVEKMKIKRAAFIGNFKSSIVQNKSRISSLKEELAALSTTDKNVKKENKRVKFTTTKEKEQKDNKQKEERLERNNEEFMIDEAASIDQTRQNNFLQTNSENFKQSNFRDDIGRQNNFQRDNFAGKGTRQNSFQQEYIRQENFGRNKTRQNNYGQDNVRGNNNGRGISNSIENQENKMDVLVICYKCQAVGHKANRCPTSLCYVCQQRGHIANTCKQNPNLVKERQFCQVCEKPGVIFKNCPNCEYIKNNLGNLQRGE